MGVTTAQILYNTIIQNNLSQGQVYKDKTNNIEFIVDNQRQVWINAIDKNSQNISYCINDSYQACRQKNVPGSKVQQINPNDGMFSWIMGKLPHIRLQTERVLFPGNGNSAIAPNFNNNNNIQPNTSNISNTTSNIDLKKMFFSLKNNPNNLQFTSGGTQYDLEWGAGKTTTYIKCQTLTSTGFLEQKQYIIDQNGKVKVSDGFYNPKTKKFPSKLRNTQIGSDQDLKLFLQEIHNFHNKPKSVNSITNNNSTNNRIIKKIKHSQIDKAIPKKWAGPSGSKPDVKNRYPHLYEFLTNPNCYFSQNDLKSKAIYDMGWEDAFGVPVITNKKDKKFLKLLMKKYPDEVKTLIGNSYNCDNKSLRFANNEVAHLLDCAAKNPNGKYNDMLHDCLHYLLVIQ